MVTPLMTLLPALPTLPTTRRAKSNGAPAEPGSPRREAPFWWSISFSLRPRHCRDRDSRCAFRSSISWSHCALGGTSPSQG